MKTVLLSLALACSCIGCVSYDIERLEDNIRAEYAGADTHHGIAGLPPHDVRELEYGTTITIVERSASGRRIDVHTGTYLYQETKRKRTGKAPPTSDIQEPEPAPSISVPFALRAHNAEEAEYLRTTSIHLRHEDDSIEMFALRDVDAVVNVEALPHYAETDVATPVGVTLLVVLAVVVIGGLVALSNFNPMSGANIGAGYSGKRSVW